MKSDQTSEHCVEAALPLLLDEGTCMLFKQNRSALLFNMRTTSPLPGVNLKPNELPKDPAIFLLIRPRTRTVANSKMLSLAGTKCTVCAACFVCSLWLLELRKLQRGQLGTLL